MKKIARNEVRDELVLMNEGFQILTNGQVKVKLLSGFSKGETVKAGTPVALVGGTPGKEDANHLHFELWLDGQSIDPTRYISF